MKTFWLTGSALALLVAVVPAMAADLPAPPAVYKAPPAAAPAYSWTGFYVGAGSGYAIWNGDTSVQSAAGAPLFGTSTLGGKGWLGAAFVGYDYQLTDHIVVGALGDFDFGDVKGQFSDPATAATGTMKETTGWAAGARIGWLVFPEALAYVSGGFTQAHFSGFSLTTGDTIPSHDYSGWFASVGVETTFPILGNGWFFRSDYRYSQYNSASLAEVAPAGVIADVQTFHPYVQTITAGVIYKFNSAPVSAPFATFSFADFFKPPQGPARWTGLYVAAGGGYGTSSSFSTSNSAAGVPIASVTNGGRGGFGTVNAGYDYQVTDRLVAGVFGDFDFANIRGTFQDPNPAAPIAGTMTENSAWAVGVRGGWLLTPAVLNYYDAGFTQAEFSGANLSGVANLPSHTYDGWFFGSGLETALPFLGNGWFARVEYRYSTFDKTTLPENLVAGGLRDTITVEPNVQTVRVELVYRF